MTSNPVVSIIIPVYNAEQMLNQCIRSCLDQSYRPIEIIAINDCSTDNSGALLNNFSQKYPEISIINHLQNRGPQVSRPEAIQLAKGEFILFLDADDWFNGNDAVSDLVNQQALHQADIVIGGYNIVSDGILLKKAPPKLETTDIVKKLCYLYEQPFRTLWGKLYRKTLFKDLAIPEKIYHCEDVILNTQILSNEACKNVVSLSKIVYNYRILSTSITHNRSFENAMNALDAQIWIFNYLDKKHLLANTELLNEFRGYMIHKITNVILLKDAHKLQHNYVKLLYKQFYNDLPKKYKLKTSRRFRILFDLEHYLPMLTSTYLQLLSLIDKILHK